tara:strand:+ start:5038 stop:5403 length:366 start_codon:yes stop_codon:yes gene_type:complete
MKRKFKLIFFLTLFLFFILILSDALFKVELKNDGWYSLAIMFFFSFSYFKLEVLEKNINKGASFVKVYLILTIAKLFCSAFFIITYGTLKADGAEPSFFIWFFILYLIYTSFIGFMFNKKK